MRRLMTFALALGLPAAAAEYPDPERYRGAIEAFLSAEAAEPPPTDAIVATGSSSMRGWHQRIAADLAPLSIIPRGFGGSNMADVLHFVDELVLRHSPRAVLLYEGDNDIALGASPQRVLADFDALAKAIHESLPQGRIYAMAVKPSPARWHLWDAMQAVNAGLARRAEADERLTFIDVATPMLNDAGEPKPHIFIADGLHMNDTGYRIWRDAARPVLLAGEGAAENMPVAE